MQHVANKPTTQFSGQFSIFEALYELENFGQPGIEERSTAVGTSDRQDNSVNNAHRKMMS